MPDERLSRRNVLRTGLLAGAAAMAAPGAAAASTPPEWANAGGGGQEGRQGRRQHLSGRRLRAGPQGLHPGLSRHQARAHAAALAGLRAAHPPGAPGQPLHLGRGHHPHQHGLPGAAAGRRVGSRPAGDHPARGEGRRRLGGRLRARLLPGQGPRAHLRLRRQPRRRHHHQHRPGQGGSVKGLTDLLDPKLEGQAAAARRARDGRRLLADDERAPQPGRRHHQEALRGPGAGAEPRHPPGGRVHGARPLSHRPRRQPAAPRPVPAPGPRQEPQAPPRSPRWTR